MWEICIFLRQAVCAVTFLCVAWLLFAHAEDINNQRRSHAWPHVESWQNQSHSGHGSAWLFLLLSRYIPSGWNTTLRHSWLLCRHKLSANDFFFPFHWVAMGDCQAAAMTVSPLPRHLSSLYIIFSMSLSLRFPFSPPLLRAQVQFTLTELSSVFPSALGLDSDGSSGRTE